MIVLRIDVHGHSADVRWAGGEAVVGAGDAASIQRDDAGWGDREAVLVHCGDHLLVVPTDGTAPRRLDPGGAVRLRDATLTLLGLGPVRVGDDTPRAVLPAREDVALPPAPSAPGAFPSVADPAPASTVSASAAGTSPGPAGALGSEASPAATGPTGPPATPTGRDPAPGTAGPAPGPHAGLAADRPRSFDEELVDVLRRSPWWILSAAVHALVFVLLSLIPGPEHPAPPPPVLHGLVTADVDATDPLESGGPLDPLPEAPPEPLEAPELDAPRPDLDPPLPDDPRRDAEPTPLPVEPTVPDDPETAPPLVGPAPTATTARVRERNVAGKRPPASDLDRVNDDAERSREVNQAAAARVKADIASGGGPLGKVLKGLRTEDLLVVRGSFDHMENVLEELGLPYTLRAPFELADHDLSRHKVVFWNCGENVLRPHEQERVVAAVRDFVERGGYLFTTDWALANLLMPAFPGRLRTRGRLKPLPELIVPVEPAEGKASHPLLEGVFDGVSRPRWWLEQASFDVEVARRGHVEVLVEAPSLATPPWERSTAVVVTFTHGRGRVLHALGHYYQQKGNVSGAVGAQRLPLNFVRQRMEAVATER